VFGSALLAEREVEIGPDLLLAREDFLMSNVLVTVTVLNGILGNWPKRH